MESMDRARRIGAYIWITAGSIAVWLLPVLTSSSVGAITQVACFIVLGCALVTALSGRPGARWVSARLAGLIVGVEFLGAVSDRFGAFGAPGEPGVSWGSWSNFVDYTGQLWPLSGFTVELVAVAATSAEVVLGVALLLGWSWRWVGKLSAGLLFSYAVFMVATVGLSEVFLYGVPSLVGAALLTSSRGAKPTIHEVAVEEPLFNRTEPTQPNRH